MDIINTLGSYYGGVIILFMLHRLIYGEWPEIKWEYFIPIWGIMFYITDNI